MARTNSTMMALGTPAPDFDLPDTSLEPGRHVRLADFAGQPLLVVFMCNHCPYVKHLADAFAAFAREYRSKGLSIVAISSNDATQYPDDSPDAMTIEAGERDYTFAYLYDETQAVAKAYRAACTPDFFLFDTDHKLAYRGQFDDTRPKQDPPQLPTGADLRAAADAVLAREPVAETQYPSMGCNIKWKPGNEPEYFGAV